MACGAVLFALMGFFARLASAHVSWTLVAASRAAIGAAVAIGVARLRRAPMRVHDRRGIWARSLFGTVSMLCTFYAVGSPAISLGDSTTLVNLTPIFLAILGPFLLRERSGKRVALALPLSAIGVVLILRPAFLFGAANAPLSPAGKLAAGAAVAGALSSAFAMVMLRKMGPRESPEAIAIHFSLTASVLLGILSIPHLVVPCTRDVFCIGAAGLAAGLAQLAMTRAYALEQAARVSGIGYLSVVTSAALGALALHEWPDRGALAGMALVIAGGLVVTVAGLREGKSAAPQ